ncbi:MAG: sugar ABC transporter ATP-binding protein, partial [Desulfosporosinus sp.]
IQKLVVELAGDGKSVLFISSELDEVIRCASRAYIYRDKHIIDELTGEALNESNILKTIASESEVN